MTTINSEAKATKSGTTKPKHKPASNAGRKWTAAEDAILRERKAQGLPYAAFVHELGRTNLASRIRYCYLLKEDYEAREAGLHAGNQASFVPTSAPRAKKWKSDVRKHRSLIPGPAPSQYDSLLPKSPEERKFTLEAIHGLMNYEPPRQPNVHPEWHSDFRKYTKQQGEGDRRDSPQSTGRDPRMDVEGPTYLRPA